MQHDHFGTQHLQDNLRGRALRGGVVTLIGQATKLAVNLLGIVVLARLLTPSDYGLVAMVVAVTSFLEIFKTLGLLDATVQARDIRHSQASTLFFINLLTALCLFATTLALAPLLAHFYHEPRVLPLAMVQACTFLIGGLYIQHMALMRRQMRYASLVGVDILYMAVSVGVGIGCAWSGLGYWSLVIGSLSAETVVCLLLWSINRWRPGWHFRWSEVREMVLFGVHMQMANVLAVIPIKLDNILIGRFWGSRDLGIYSRAFSLAFLPTEQMVEAVRAIAVPTLSRLQQDPPRFRQYYLKALSLLTHFSLPTTMFFVMMSEEVVALVLGSKWQAVAPIFRMLCIVALVLPIGESHKWVNVSLGRGQRMFRISMAIAVAFVTAIVAGLPYGPIGIATAIAGVYWVGLLPVLYYALQDSPVSLSDLLRTVRAPFLAAMIAGVCMGVLKWWGAGLPDLLCLILALLITLAVALLVATWSAGEADPRQFLRKSVAALRG